MGHPKPTIQFGITLPSGDNKYRTAHPHGDWPGIAGSASGAGKTNAVSDLAGSAVGAGAASAAGKTDAASGPAGSATGGGSSAPSWVNSASPGFWAQINNNELDDIDPDPSGAAAYQGNSGHESTCDKWNGGALLGDQYLVAGGGHADYYGNQINSFDLFTGLWSRLTEPYPSTTFPISGGWWPAHTGHPNGSISMPHTYGGQVAFPPSNSIVFLSRQATNTGSSIPAPGIFDLDTNQWRKGKQYAGTGSPTFDDNTGAYDSLRELVWARGGQTGAAFASFNPTTDNGDGTWGTWTEYADQGSESGTMMQYDPALDKIVMVGAVGGQNLWGIDPANPNSARVALTQSNRPTLSTRVGIVYSPKREAFLVWENGENVWELKKGSGAWNAATWTWTNIVHASNTLAPTKNQQGTFTRLQRKTYGAREFLIVVNTTSGPVYNFEIP